MSEEFEFLSDTWWFYLIWLWWTWEAADALSCCCSESGTLRRQLQGGRLCPRHKYWWLSHAPARWSLHLTTKLPLLWNHPLKNFWKLWNLKSGKLKQDFKFTDYARNNLRSDLLWSKISHNFSSFFAFSIFSLFIWLLFFSELKRLCLVSNSTKARWSFLVSWTTPKPELASFFIQSIFKNRRYRLLHYRANYNKKRRITSLFLDLPV